ncbi:MAG: hypothetical protein IJV37_01385 [Bacteroidales bacterium]|nr:hypothetical protein [Bacteroidales bacterium]
MKKKFILAGLIASLMICAAWTARAEIRGFFLSCGVVYRDVPENLSDEEYYNYYLFLERTVCGTEIEGPNNPIKENLNPVIE